MKEQKENMKTFRHLLGEAQLAIIELSEKIKNVCKNQDVDCHSKSTDIYGKSLSPEFLKQLSNDDQVLKSRQEVRLLPLPKEPLYRASIGVQVSFEASNDGNKQGFLNIFANNQGTVAQSSFFVGQATTSTLKTNVTNTVSQQKSDICVSAKQESKCSGIFTPIDVTDQEGRISDNSIKNDINVTTSNDSSKISEKSEKSGFEKKNANHASDKKQETSKAAVSCSLKNTIRSSNKKEVKSLKDIATEVVINTVISRTSNKNTLQQTSLKNDKDGGTEISHKNQQPNKQVIATVANSMKINCKGVEVSSKNKLSIQKMPPIDIRKGLTTQTIPAVVITASESMPDLNVPQDSNVAYEIVKHPSSEINVTNKDVCECFVQTDNRDEDTVKAKMPVVNVVQPVAIKEVVQPVVIKEAVEKCSVQCANIKPQMCDNGMQTDNITVDPNKLIKDKDEILPPLSVTNEENTFNPLLKDLMKVKAECCPSKSSNVVVNQVSVDVPCDDKSSITTYDYIFRKKSNTPHQPVEEVTTSVEATLKLELPVTTFVNTYFKSETESELLMLNEGDVETPTACSSTSKKSTIAELLNHKECVKEFINEMIKDPNTEIIFKSYQVLQDQSAHDPEETVNKTALSFIDSDIYRTFVDPEGLKTLEDVCSNRSKFKNNEIPQKVVNYDQDIKSLNTIATSASSQIIPDTQEDTVCNQDTAHLSVLCRMPSEFYSTKATQCGENAEVEVDDSVSQCTFLWKDDNISQSSSVWRNDDVQVPKSIKTNPNSRSSAYNIAQDSTYVSRSSKQLSYSVLPRLSKRFSHSSIPRDVQKRLSAAAGSPRNSLFRKSFQSTVLQDTDNKKATETPLSKHLSLNNNLRARSFSAPPTSNTVQDIENKETDSVGSETTEHVILEIDKELLRSKTYNSRLDLDAGSISSGMRKRSSGFKKGSSLSSNKITDSERDSITVCSSEYVITHDISIQTSLTDISEIALNLREDSTQNLEQSIESLKETVKKDILSEDDVKNTSCCAKMPWNNKKTTPEDAYIKSIAHQAGEDRMGKKSSLVRNNSYTETERATLADDLESHRKSVKIEEPEPVPVNNSKTPVLSLPQQVHSKLSRRGITPVGSFIEGLTSHGKDDIVIARNVPPKNELTVFEKYNSEEIVNAIKHDTELWKEKVSHTGLFAETASQTSEQNMKINNNVGELDEESVKDTNKTVIKNNNKLDTVSENSGSETDSVTVMTVNVEQPVVINKKFSDADKETETLHNNSVQQRKVPGGDDVGFHKCLELHNEGHNYTAPIKHEGISLRRQKHKHKHVKKVYESSSSSETATLETVSEQTEETVSEGEIKCKCSASFGEVHVCSYVKGLKPIQYLKRNPQSLMKYEFGDPHVKVERQKEFYNSWVAYYISRSPSPELDSTESPNDSSDSIGMIKK